MAVQDASEQLLQLKLAFLAGEPPACVLALARKAGGGCLTQHVQHFLLENCIGTNVEGRQNCTYSTTILKRIISELELSSDAVINELYEEFAQRMLSKAVILTDGDASTLTNMKENMELNNLCIEGENSNLIEESKNKVECKYLSWEEVSESDLWGYQPDIVLGADIIYDPVCAPHLTRVLSILLRRDGEKGKTKERSGDEFVADGPVAYIATVVRNF